MTVVNARRHSALNDQDKIEVDESWAVQLMKECKQEVHTAAQKSHNDETSSSSRKFYSQNTSAPEKKLWLF